MHDYEVVQDEDGQWTVIAIHEMDSFEIWGWFATPEDALDSIKERDGAGQLRH